MACSYLSLTKYWRGGVLIKLVAAPEPLEGVSLFLGFSRKDARVVMEGREKVSDRLPSTEEEEQLEVLSTVQQAVSYFTSNNNKVSPEIERDEMERVIMFISVGLYDQSHREEWRELRDDRHTGGVERLQESCCSDRPAGLSF